MTYDNEDVELVRINVDVIKESDEAFLVTDGYTQEWIPKSLIENRDELEPGESCEMEFPLWKAEKIGWV